MASAEKKPNENQPEEKRPELHQVPPIEQKPDNSEQYGMTEVRPQIGWISVGGLALEFIALLTPAVFAIVLAAAGAILGYFGLAEVRRGTRTGLFLAWTAIVAGVLITFLGIAVIATINR